jgi:hypothetical protein
MVKLQRTQHRRLKRALQKERNPLMRQRIQMVVLRETGMTQPEIADVTGVSLSTVNRAHMAYDRGGLETRKPKPSGGRIRGESLARPLRSSGRSRANAEHP